MKAIIVFESREGKLTENSYETLTFAKELGADIAGFYTGPKDSMPAFDGKLYYSDAGDYNPSLHKSLLLQAVEAEGADRVIFLHSSYGWDLAPRVALALGAAQHSEVVSIEGGDLELGCYNAKLRRTLGTSSKVQVITIQAGAFNPAEAGGSPEVVEISGDTGTKLTFTGYEAAEAKELDLTKSEVIVSAGRGIGKKENIDVVAALATALGGDLGASRPVVDSEWIEHSHQVGTTGQTVTPKLYVACGISGAIQHLAGMKNSEFIVAINKDKDAPIGEIADVFCVADLLQLAPAIVEKLKK